MTTDLIFDSGEELLIKQGYDGQQVRVGLYLDQDSSDGTQTGDNLSSAQGESAITTEPSNGNYTPVTLGLSASTTGDGDGGTAHIAENSGTEIVFNFEDVVQGSSSAQFVDAAYVAYDGPDNFDLIANPSMTQERNTASFDQLKIAVGDFAVGVDGTLTTA